MNPTEVSKDSRFARCIAEYFKAHKPRKIIETGLYHGNGSTSIIASLIRDIPLPDATFYSIECNPNNVRIGNDNLVDNDLSKFVSILSGISIPKCLLPSIEDINKRINIARSILGIKLDHEQDLEKSPNYYERETQGFVHEDIIGWILGNWNNSVDFALLDSGGHVGNIEFKHFISRLKSPCGIALDDTRHFKHYESRNMIMKDKRFDIINDSEEKFGFMIVRFFP